MNRKSFVVLRPECVVICVLSFCQMSHHLSVNYKQWCLCISSFVYIHAIQHDICDISSMAQRIVGKNNQKSMLYCKIQPGIFGTLHFKYIVLGHTKSFSGTLNNVSHWQWLQLQVVLLHNLDLIWLTCLLDVHNQFLFSSLSNISPSSSQHVSLSEYILHLNSIVSGVALVMSKNSLYLLTDLCK